MASDQAVVFKPSPFFFPPKVAEADSLAILHLKRDSLLPITLSSTADDGYAEGAVTNTRFGSFPHSTLIGLEWGSQVRASKVDTGSRGRKGKRAKQDESTTGDDSGFGSGEASQKKRKPDDQDEEGPSSPRKKFKPSATTEQAQQPPPPKVPIEAGSGFVHILPPTPESWTYSLDHRTQVVYTPDSSYILQQLRVRPGDSLIEAGAGSGSFTHAAARAVFNGNPNPTPSTAAAAAAAPPTGQVYSFEYHEPRVQSLRAELSAHGLDPTVQLTHRDVCADGFRLPASALRQQPVSAIFLDLPAPWLALKHLTRGVADSPLDRSAAVRLCSFSPCIEQVMATTAQLRRSGWVGLRVVEVANRRIDVRRERVGFREEGLRGTQATAADVAEAVTRLREVERRFQEFNSDRGDSGAGGGGGGNADENHATDDSPTVTEAVVAAAASGDATNKRTRQRTRFLENKQQRLRRIRREAEERKLYREGNLVHRTEPEVKNHTSYLVFAVLPREWTEEDERRCGERWSVDALMKGEK